MIELNCHEIENVSGGRPAGTLRRPVADPESELGRQINDIAGALNDFGSWLGSSIYDWTH